MPKNDPVVEETIVTPTSHRFPGAPVMTETDAKNLAAREAEKVAATKVPVPGRVESHSPQANVASRNNIVPQHEYI